jgi:aminomethyltransferase
MGTEKKKTALFDWHVANGGNMVEFGDYVMPLWYAGTKREHLAVVTSAGIFDTSHMAVVMVSGSGSFDLIQRCFTRDLNACIGKDNAPISPGRCVYGAYLDEQGHAIDDAIVYKYTDDEWMVVVNAGMGGVIATHLESQKGSLDVTATDLTDKLGKIDIQGPAAVKTMRQLVKSPETVFKKLFYFSFKGHFDDSSEFATQVQLEDGTPFVLSRSGYTGEVGFEVFTRLEHTVKIWEAVIEAGAEHGLVPCGLAARDSLRTGAVLPLSHQDIGHWTYINHPWPFALPYDEAGAGFTKSFLGREAITGDANAEHTLAFVGNDLRKVDAHDAVVNDLEGHQIGEVLTCATDMAIGRHEGRIFSIATADKPAGLKIKGLSCGFIKVKQPLEPGAVVELADQKRKIKVTIETDIRPDRTARKPLKKFLK